MGILPYLLLFLVITTQNTKIRGFRFGRDKKPILVNATPKLEIKNYR